MNNSVDGALNSLKQASLLRLLCGDKTKPSGKSKRTAYSKSALLSSFLVCNRGMAWQYTDPQSLGVDRIACFNEGCKIKEETAFWSPWSSLMILLMFSTM